MLRFFLVISSLILAIFLSFVFLLIYLRRPDWVTRKSGISFSKTVSVIIPAYNEGVGLRETLDSVLRTNYPHDLMEVIVVDDGSTDNTYEVAKKYEPAGVKVLRKKNGGAASAKNFGLKFARGEIVVTVDSDTVLMPNTIPKLVSYFDEPGVAGVSGAIRVYKPRTWLERIQAIEYDVILFLRRVLESIDCVYVTPGATSAFRRDVLLQLGGFDERSLTEDQEIALHMQRAGYKVRSSLDAISYTKVPKTFWSLIKQRVRWVRGGIWNRLKHKALLDPKYGDFVIFGMLLDIFFFFPFALFITNTILMLLNEGNWFARLGIDIFFLSIDFTWFSFLVIFLMIIPWNFYMANWVRRFAGEKELGNKIQDWIDMISYLFVFGYIWFIVWPIVIYKEMFQKQLSWETR